MSEQTISLAPWYVTCLCQNCNQGIEFDANLISNGASPTVECPHCHLETRLFAPTPPKLPSPRMPLSKKSFRMVAIVLWIVTGILFFILPIIRHGLVLLLGCASLTAAAIVTGKFKHVRHVLWITTGVLLLIAVPIVGNSTPDYVGVLFLAAVALFITALVASRMHRTREERRHPPKANYICTNCGTLLTWTFKGRPTENDNCSECGTNRVVPLETPRGQELLATYHGAVSAKERIEINDEATKKLLQRLEPAPLSANLAEDLEKLAALVRTGAITQEEWQRAKGLYLGLPEKKKKENSLARIRHLFELCQSGALSESEFNMMKWDILSRGAV